MHGTLKLRELRFTSATPRNQDGVPTRAGIGISDYFAQPSPDPVTHHGVADAFPSDEAETAAIQAIGQQADNQQIISGTTSPTVDFPDTGIAAKTMTLLHLNYGSRGRPLETK